MSSNVDDADLNKYLIYLDDLREIGTINMFGAAEYLAKKYHLGLRFAEIVVEHWMKTFKLRHK